jgi:lysyl-tRNA synthetase class 2
MATLKELRSERLRKLSDIRALGVDPYPAEARPTHQISEITSDYKKFAGQSVTVAGRIVGMRKFGQIAFVVLRDFSGELQLFLKKSEVVKFDKSKNFAMENLSLLDSGDFIEASGEVIKTKTGEISVAVKTFRLLTKSLRQLPLNFTNKEERLRRRYVDMAVNREVRDRFVRRSKFWQANRDFLNQHGFIEINIPVLEHTTGGADANPFVTHMDALDQDFYLRISHELPLKRLIGAGYERVYDIGPRFRNENYSDEHLPEHVALEWYAAYWDWQDGREFMEQMFKYTLQETFGKLKFKTRGFEVDLADTWAVHDYAELMGQHYGIDVYNTSLSQVQKALQQNNIEVEKSDNLPRSIDKLWKTIRATIGGPAWVINEPKFLSPLAKTAADGRSAERFHPIIAGSELGNGFSELNDPIDQLSRFREQQQMRDAGDDEAMMLDIDFIEMLEYGIPPTCGWGHSERVFWFFEGVSAREGVPFPQLRQEIDEVTKSIYPEIKLS